MTIQTETGLETPDYTAQGWQAILNANIRKYNQKFLKYLALLDVDAYTCGQDGAIPTWNAAKGKFIGTIYNQGNY